VAISYTTFI